MTGDEARQATVAGELALAQECLAEARFALQGGFFRLVRSRAYYACFHAATAVFTARGQSFRRHTGILAAVDDQLVQTKLLPQDSAAVMRGLYQSRLRSDYGDSAPVTPADATRALADAETLVKLLSDLAVPADGG